jgi:surface antigen
MILKKLASILVLSILVIGCAEQGGPLTKQGAGTILGGAGGALLGSQFGKGSGKVGMIALGALAGAAIGNTIGAGMDKTDKIYHTQVAQRALETAPSGNAVEWRNPDSGHYGSVTPTRTFKAPSGEYCREYTQTVTVAGKQQQAYGKACRQPDGTWRIVE